MANDWRFGLALGHLAKYLGDMTNSRAAHLAAELRAARRLRNLTQAELAESSGVSVWAINRIERCAATRIDVGQIIALAESLRIESKDLVPSLAEDGAE